MMNDKKIIALGFFDGVHLGHQVLLRQCCTLATQRGCLAAAITFDRHPQSLFRKDPPPLLTTGQDRRRLLREYGIGSIFQYPVEEKTMSMPWQAFLEELISFGGAGFVCGQDFRFGYRGAGDAEKLSRFCEERSLPCVIVPEQSLDAVRISSTHIRSLLALGHMETAKKFLGHPHLLTGKVVTGRRLGGKLGFPTANVLIPPGIACPRHGVYACTVRVDGQPFIAVTNVGSRPTVDGHQVRTESWLLDFSGDLYGKTVTLEFHYFLRPEKKFDSLEQLQAAVQADAARARSYFGEN